MANIELKIDGEVIVLTSQQTAQLKRAIKKETEVSVPPPRYYGNLLVSCHPNGPKSSYPLLITSCYKVDTTWKCPPNHCGYNLGLEDVKNFIEILKEQAAKIWKTAEKELKNI